MPRRRIAPHEIAWEVARWAERHMRHEPTPMRSGCSTPPIRMWVCDVLTCQSTAHTLTDVPPICYGGYSTKTTYLDD